VCGPVEVGERRRHRSREQPVAGLDDGHGRAEGAGARGDLETDEASADDDDVTTASKRCGQDVCVGDGAQREHSLEVGSLDGKGGLGGARREGEAGEVELTAGCRGGLPARSAPVDRDHRVAGDQLDALLVEPGAVSQHEGGSVLLPAQVGLRQGRALVGHLGLVTEEDDRVLVAERSQLCDERQARLPRADDERAAVSRHHPCAPSSCTPRVPGGGRPL
jgi:hypothetical protein